MTDPQPAELSSSLLARKGMAGVEGFAQPELDPSRPAWSRARKFRVAGLLLMAAAVGATGTWLADSGSHKASPMVSSPAPVRGERVASTPFPVAMPDLPAREPDQPPEKLVALVPPTGEEAPPPALPSPPAAAKTSAGEFGLTPEQKAADAMTSPLRPAAFTETQQPAKPKTPIPSAHLANKASATATRGFRVQLHSLQSREAIEREWVKLRRRHSDLLTDKQLVIDRLDVAGGAPLYRMQLGNLPTRTSARQLCRALSDRGQQCFLVPTS